MTVPSNERLANKQLPPAQRTPAPIEIVGKLTDAEHIAAVAAIDTQTVDILNRRLGHALAADAEKDRLGLPSLAPSREIKILDYVKEHNVRLGSHLDTITLIQAYTNLMRTTRANQLLARAARNTITPDEIEILEYITDQTVERQTAAEQPCPEPEEALDVAAANRRRQSEIRLAEHRAAIDEIDLELIRLWSTRQLHVIALSGRPLVGIAIAKIQLVGNMWTEVTPDTREPLPKFHNIDLISLLEPLFIAMKRRQKEIADSSQSHPETMDDFVALPQERDTDYA